MKLAGLFLDNDTQTPTPPQKEPTIRFFEHTLQTILRRKKIIKEFLFLMLNRNKKVQNFFFIRFRRKKIVLTFQTILRISFVSRTKKLKKY